MRHMYNNNVNGKQLCNVLLYHTWRGGSVWFSTSAHLVNMARCNVCLKSFSLGFWKIHLKSFFKMRCGISVYNLIITFHQKTIFHLFCIMLCHVNLWKSLWPHVQTQKPTHMGKGSLCFISSILFLLFISHRPKPNEQSSSGCWVWPLWLNTVFYEFRR